MFIYVGNKLDKQFGKFVGVSFCKAGERVRLCCCVWICVQKPMVHVPATNLNNFAYSYILSNDFGPFDDVSH